jgi:hypothetical protein
MSAAKTAKKKGKSQSKAVARVGSAGRTKAKAALTRSRDC